MQKAHAKINLVLNVLGKRADGFHEVDFVMANLDLYDLITIDISKTDEIIMENAPYIKKESNIAFLAWDIIRKKYSIDKCVTIKIKKVIPVSAGLAGGSADAAAVIRGINKLFDLKISKVDMLSIAATLGSDVPFCLNTVPMRATGRGETVKPIKLNYPKYYVVLVNPNRPLSTGKVYGNFVKDDNLQDIEKFLEGSSNESFYNNIHNSLQETSIKMEPRIMEIVKYVETKFDYKWIVSGSGPTVVYFLEDKEEMKELFEYCKIKYKRSYYTKMR